MKAKRGCSGAQRGVWQAALKRRSGSAPGPKGAPRDCYGSLHDRYYARLQVASIG